MSEDWDNNEHRNGEFDQMKQPIPSEQKRADDMIEDDIEDLGLYIKVRNGGVVLISTGSRLYAGSSLRT